ncbi:hypothetical protein A2U01_0096481, partial [Trifolium medium]|nr:hypothetical protein [Trifolium medium]
VFWCVVISEKLRNLEDPSMGGGAIEARNVELQTGSGSTTRRHVGVEWGRERRSVR